MPPARGVITTVKEAVDNALDACEEAEVLPDIEIEVRRIGPETCRIAVEDNGPGIVPENVPFVFGKLLYGSRFHQIRQSRGQQGIGISAAKLLYTFSHLYVRVRAEPERNATVLELMGTATFIRLPKLAAAREQVL